MRLIGFKEERWFIEHCCIDPKIDDPNTFCDGCPVYAECLYYYTGDDSELSPASEWRENNN